MHHNFYFHSSLDGHLNFLHVLAIIKSGALQIDTNSMENSMEISLKTRNKTTIWPNNPTTGHII